MTRCQEFYEKLEKDGNFCGMTEEDYREAMEYYGKVEKDKSGKPVLSCGAWLKAVKEEAKRFKEVEPEKPKEPKHQNKADFMEECVAFWTKARRHWEEEVIEEVLDKARISTR